MQPRLGTHRGINFDRVSALVPGGDELVRTSVEALSWAHYVLVSDLAGEAPRSPAQEFRVGMYTTVVDQILDGHLHRLTRQSRNERLGYVTANFCAGVRWRLAAETGGQGAGRFERDLRVMLDKLVPTPDGHLSDTADISGKRADRTVEAARYFTAAAHGAEVATRHRTPLIGVAQAGKVVVVHTARDGVLRLGKWFTEASQAALDHTRRGELSRSKER